MHKARRDGLAGVLAVIQQAGGPGLVVASSGDRYTVGIQHDGQFGQLTPRWSLQLVEAWLYGYRDALQTYHARNGYGRQHDLEPTE